MDLIKLELAPLDFRQALDGAEREAIVKRRAAQSDALRRVTGLLTMVAVMVMGTCAMMGAVFALAPSHGFLAILAGLAGFCATLVASLATFSHYLEPSDRKLLPYLLEPQAKAFFLENVDRRERLLEEAAAFDAALRVFKGLPERAGDEVNEAVAVNFAERRASLEAGSAAYLSEFAAATEDDRARVAAIEKARATPKYSVDRRLDEFQEKVSKLRDLERALDGLHGSIKKGITVDLSPFIAVQRLRAELEEEREALVARGLKPKKLPKPRVAARKLLPAAT